MSGRACAADPAQEHGLLEADHRAPCCRYPLEDYIWRVSSGQGGVKKEEEETVQLVVCCMWRPVRLEEYEQNLGHTG